MTQKKRKRYCRNIWHAQDVGDMSEFMRHLTKMVEAGTLSTPTPYDPGLTILHASAHTPDMFKALIEAGADHTVRNAAGLNAMEYADSMRVWGEDDDAFAERLKLLSSFIAAKEAQELAAITARQEPASTRNSGRL